MWSRNCFRARIDQHGGAIERVLDNNMVVVIGTMQLHRNGSGGNPDRGEHGSQKDDVIVAVTVGKTLLSDGVEKDKRGLDEFSAIGVGEVDHLLHHPLGNGVRVRPDVVVDARIEERESCCPDAWISTKLFDHKLDRADDRPRIRGFWVQWDAVYRPIWCEQVFAKRNSRCCLIVYSAPRGGLRLVVNHLHRGCVPTIGSDARQGFSC